MSQSVFRFAAIHDYSPENFLVSPSNREAYDYVRNFPWPSYALNIHGPSGSGKTYLANIASRPAVEILDGVDAAINQQEFLHHLNSAKESEKYILITSNQPLAEIAFTLPDLTSRLAAINSIRINKPDNELFYQLFARNFSARQLKIGDDVISYLSSRVERDFGAAMETVDKIDRLSLEQKRNITVPLVKKILADAA